MADSDNKTGNKLLNDPALPNPDERIKGLRQDLVDNQHLGQDSKDIQSLINKDVAQDIKLKKQIVWWVMGVVSLYLLAVIWIVESTGRQERLEPIVLVALLTTTTINILGLPLVIINSLFPKRNKSDKWFNSSR